MQPRHSLPSVSQFSRLLRGSQDAWTLDKKFTRLNIIDGGCDSGDPLIDYCLVHLKCQRLDALGESLHCLGELSILLEHLHEKGRLLRRDRGPFLTSAMQSLTMFRVGEGMGRVAIGLARLREQDEWSRIRRLQAEGEVEEDEWIDVERCKPEDINENPNPQQ